MRAALFVTARDHGPEAMPVAGGTDLYPNMKRRQFTPKVLVGLRHVDEARGVHVNGGLDVGAPKEVRLCDPVLLTCTP